MSVSPLAALPETELPTPSRDFPFPFPFPVPESAGPAIHLEASRCCTPIATFEIGKELARGTE